MIVHNKFTKKNSSIAEFSQTIIDNFSARAALFQSHPEFLGMTSNISESGDSLTVSLEWSSNEDRHRITKETTLRPYPGQLEDYCLANGILKTISVT